MYLSLNKVSNKDIKETFYKLGLKQKNVARLFGTSPDYLSHILAYEWSYKEKDHFMEELMKLVLKEKKK